MSSDKRIEKFSAFDKDEDESLLVELPKGFHKLTSREIASILDESTVDQISDEKLLNIEANIKNQDKAHLTVKFNNPDFDDIDRSFELVEGSTNVYISEFEEGKPSFIFNSFSKPNEEKGYTIKLYVITKPIQSSDGLKALIVSGEINSSVQPLGYFSIEHKGDYLMYIIAGASVVLLLIIFLMTRKKKDDYYY